MGNYDRFKYLDITVADGVATIEIGTPAYTMGGHYEVNAIWRELDVDREVRAAILTWADPPKEPLGPLFPPEMGPEAAAEDAGKWWSRWQWPAREAREGIRDLLDSNTMVVSALRGQVPFGASLILATLADVSIAAEDATIAEHHIHAGIVAGDGAVHWAYSAGAGRAKYLALTGAEITGAQAEAMGLVTLALPDYQVMDKAREIARRLADGPQHAQNYTKRAFNQIYRLGNVLGMEVGQAYELLGLVADPDVATAGAWGRAGQGQPRDYDLDERPTLPSTENPYGPDELRP